MNRLWRAFAWLAVILIGGTIHRAHAAGAADGFVFTVEAAADRDQVVEVFYEFGTGWRQESSARRDLAGDGAWHSLAFPIPAVPLQQLRLDPGWGGATLRFRSASLAERNGAVLRTWSPPPLKPLQQIARADVHDGVLTLVHASGTDDPITLLDEPLYPLVQPRLAAHGWPHWTAPALAFAVGLLVLFVLGSALWLAAAGPRRRTSLLIAGGVFLAVLGLRGGWVVHYGSPVPFNDEWDSEARVALRSWAQGTLDWSTLAAPHNEHRLVLSRLLAIGGTALRGDWDPRVGMFASAALAAWVAALAALLVVRALPSAPATATLVIAALVALQGLPTDPANLLWGGQIQMYLLIALAMATLALATLPGRTTCGTFALFAGALLSLGTMGSGFVAPALAAAFAAWVAAKSPSPERSTLRRFAPAVGLAALAVLGFWWRADATHHHALHAANVHEWAATMLRLMAWPWSGWSIAVLLWLPWLALAILLVRRSAPTGGIQLTALALGAWLLVQAAALAYARGRGNAPEPRHFTVFLLTPVAVSLALVALTPAVDSRGLRRFFAVPAVLVPLLVTAWTIPGAWRELAATRDTRAEQAQMVRAFLATHDPWTLTDKTRVAAPYQQPLDLAGLLSEKVLVPYLPASLREAPGANATGAGPDSRLSAANVGFAATTFLGLGLLFGGTRRHFRRSHPG